MTRIDLQFVFKSLHFFTTGRGSLNIEYHVKCLVNINVSNGYNNQVIVCFKNKDFGASSTCNMTVKTIDRQFFTCSVETKN